MASVRLQKFIADAGVAARRKGELLITEGRVKVNGKVVTTLGTKIDPARDTVEVDGEGVAALDHFYVVLNKPKACIAAVSDDRGRPTVMDFLPRVPAPVRPVGRLDFYTEGVLLLTNDGELAARLLAPTNHVPKTYHVKIHGTMREDEIKALRNGVRLDDGTVTLPAEVNVLPAESKHTWLAITLHEGKNRQIHRMIEALGHFVDKLQRVAFATLSFHGLRVGDARELTQQELNELLDLVGLPRGPVSRGRWRASREDTDIPRRARQKARDEAEEAANAAEAGAGPEGGPRASDVGPADEQAPRESNERRGHADDRRGPRDRDDRRGPGLRGRPSEGRGPAPRGRADERRGAGPRGPSSDRRGPSSDRGPRGASSDRGPRGASSDRRGPSSDRGPRGASSDRRGPSSDRGPRGASSDRRGPSDKRPPREPRDGQATGRRRSFGQRGTKR